MEYTPMEKDILAMMQRTDFKNLSKGDVISFASKIVLLFKEENDSKKVRIEFFLEDMDMSGVQKDAIYE